MGSPSVLIVGGGMAGLSAGCYARMNGLDATIVEQHDIAGGLCTAWTRRGYTFDISIHLLTCSRSGGMATMWRELGVLQGRTFVDHEIAAVQEFGGERLVWYADLDKLEAEMLRISPGDATVIRELIEAARLTTEFDIWMEKPQAIWNPYDMTRFVLGNLSMIRFMRKWGGVPVVKFAERFESPVLRSALRLLDETSSWPMPDFPMPGFLFMLGLRHARNSGYPVGGSYNIAQTLVKRFTLLGGQIVTRARVSKIIVENDRAVGVRLDDGRELRADSVVSAGDGRTAIWDLLEGRYLGEKICRFYREWQVYPPLVMVMLGVARSFSGEPSYNGFELPQPIEVAGQSRVRMEMVQYGHDPAMAPAGKSVVQVWYTTDWDYWQRFAADPDGYDAERQRIADAVIGALDQRWPGFAGQVEVVDVPTPVTFRRYTGNEQGSPDGWCVTTKTGMSSMPVTLPGLRAFYMAGQWTMPFSGVPGAAMSGRAAIQMICHDAKRRFVTSLPPAGWGPVDAHPKDKAVDFRRRIMAKAAAPTAVAADAPNGHAPHVTIDATICSGCGDCTVEAPEVFALSDQGAAQVLVDKLTPESVAAVRSAIERCPEGAISLN